MRKIFTIFYFHFKYMQYGLKKYNTIPTQCIICSYAIIRACTNTFSPKSDVSQMVLCPKSELRCSFGFFFIQKNKASWVGVKDKKLLWLNYIQLYYNRAGLCLQQEKKHFFFNTCKSYFVRRIVVTLYANL